MPTAMVDAEIKLESSASHASVFLRNYTGADVSNGFTEYTIPLADFSGVNFASLTIPFTIWNPKNASQSYVPATVLIDNVISSSTDY